MSRVAGQYFIGVDVGTGSARAALVSANGKVLDTCSVPIRTWNPLPDHFEQSSEDIWLAVCECVQKVTKNQAKENISGIGFDATCSLVALDEDDKPITVSTSGAHEQNVVLWMDHRANIEAQHINATNHELLRFVGGQVSLEMQMPKLLWIKKHLPDTWRKSARFFDLPDYLTYRSTGVDVRSLCSVVCKWNYDARHGSWSKEYFDQIGLGELATMDKIGSQILAPGTAIGNGLTDQAATELGLLPGVPVGVSMIDAHAGAVALFGCSAEGVNDDVASKLALICGTSTCHMSLVRSPLFVDGVWGPYLGAVFENTYLHEAGQSATGILLDYVIKSHAAYSKLLELTGDQHPHEYLNQHLRSMNDTNVHELSKDLHIWPDYHGNRSPLADPKMRGMVCGLSMSNDIDNLAVMYLATVQALAYGTRHILEALQSQGRPPFASLCLCGGLSKNGLFVQTHADVCAMPVLQAIEPEMVLVGAATLGACASRLYPNLEEASKCMAGKANVIIPQNLTKNYHDRKYRVFLKMLDNQREYDNIMNA